jgi:tetratricopeptide (TPR) repeat protein
MSARAETSSKTLVTAVLVMTVAVMALGGAVVAIKLRPESLPTSATERAIEQWRRAVIADPKSDSARVGLGMAYLDAGRNDEAQQAFQDALDLNGENWMALLQLGVLAKSTDPARALDLLAASAKNAPHGNRAVPLIARGDIFLQQDDAASARTAYRKAVIDSPFILEAHLGLAKALEALGDRAGALAEYEQAASFDPTNEEIAQAIERLKSRA